MNDIIAVRGGGDLATGVIQKLYRAGFHVVVLEIENPTAIRRTVSLCEAVWTGATQVEDMTAILAERPQDCYQIWQKDQIPILVDPHMQCLEFLHPTGLVDAILAKQNLGTHRDMASIVIAMGPGFTAPQDAHAIVETMRGHNLGRVYFEGSAIPNTGIPGEIGSRSAERVLRAPCDGQLLHHQSLGNWVEKGETVFSVAGQVVTAPFSGLLRGLLREGLTVFSGMKSADIDPRADSDWHSISDKARCIGGGVLEAYLYLRGKFAL